jgi:hypothetical protein
LAFLGALLGQDKAAQIFLKQSQIKTHTSLLTARLSPAQKNGPASNGANLSAFWNAAPTGQELILPQTQGGAGACPGLWEVAPLGLKLVPFGPASNLWCSSGEQKTRGGDSPGLDCWI